MAKKFHVDARSKGIIKAGVNPKGLQKWKTSEDPRAVRIGSTKSKKVEVASKTKTEPKQIEPKRKKKLQQNQSHYFDGTKWTTTRYYV